MHDVAIIGGGIGGLTTAIALRQRGIQAAVYEAAPELRPVGAGIWVPPNAMQVFDRLGLAPAVQQAGMPIRFGDILDARGERLQRADMGAVAKRFGFPTLAIHRGRLHQILVAALDPAQLHLGKACAAVTQGPDGARVRFADGDEVPARVVVGADGLRSVVRRQLFPEARLRYSGQSSYRAVVPYTLPTELAGVGAEIWGPGCRFGFSAVAPGEVYWYATLDAAPGSLYGRALFVEALAARFDSFPAPARALIEATPEATIINTDLHDLRPLRRWYAGRVGLLGDAAHATTPNLGQGGAQAVEDAAVLAECLAAYPEPARAFGVYQQRRQAKATRVVNRSWYLGKLTHVRNPLGRALRNLLMRSTPPSVAQREFERLYQLDEGVAQP